MRIRHGYWIEDNETGSLICSECGHVTVEIIGDMIEQDGKIIHRSMNPFYCSKCGADMKVREGKKFCLNENIDFWRNYSN